MNDEERLIDVNLNKLNVLKQDFKLLDDKIYIDTISQAYSVYVEVIGAVKLPGQYEIKSGTTIYDVLQKTGIVRSAVMDRIYLKRLREDFSIEFIPLNIYDILDDPSNEENIILKPFDEIEVKFKADFVDDQFIYVFGYVRKPGKYDFSDSISINDLVYMANGIRREATNSHVELSRQIIDKEGNKTLVVIRKLPIDTELQIENGDKVKLYPNDHVYIRRSNQFSELENVTIKGEVQFPGGYTMVTKNDRVLDIITRSGNVTEYAFLEGAKLIRKEEGLVLLDLKKLLSEGKNSKYNYVLREGDQILVPRINNLTPSQDGLNIPTSKKIQSMTRKKWNMI